MLGSGVPKLVQQFVTSVLMNMQQDIQGVVHNATHDDFPAWIHKGLAPFSETANVTVELGNTVIRVLKLVVPVDSFHQILEKPPDTYGSIVDICTRVLVDQGSDASFWVEGVRTLCVRGWRKPLCPLLRFKEM